MLGIADYVDQSPSQDDLTAFVRKFRADAKAATFTAKEVNGGVYDPSESSLEGDHQYPVHRANSVSETARRVKTLRSRRASPGAASRYTFCSRGARSPRCLLSSSTSTTMIMLASTGALVAVTSLGSIPKSLICEALRGATSPTSSHRRSIFLIFQDFDEILSVGTSCATSVRLSLLLFSSALRRPFSKSQLTSGSQTVVGVISLLSNFLLVNGMSPLGFLNLWLYGPRRLGHQWYYIWL